MDLVVKSEQTGKQAHFGRKAGKSSQPRLTWRSLLWQHLPSDCGNRKVWSTQALKCKVG